MTRTCDIEGCDRSHLARGLCKKHYNAALRRDTGNNKITVPCDFCGSPCTKNKDGGHARRYCSTVCRNRYWQIYGHPRARARTGTELVLHPSPSPRPAAPAREIPVVTGGRTVLVMGACGCCGASTTSRVPTGSLPLKNSLICSTACERRMSKARRRALQRAAWIEPVSPIKVYERDNWICQLCHEPLARDEAVPHPLAPTVDHIIPLAPFEGRAGGDHSMSNSQAAHFLCNATKSHRV